MQKKKKKKNWEHRTVKLTERERGRTEVHKEANQRWVKLIRTITREEKQNIGDEVT